MLQQQCCNSRGRGIVPGGLTPPRLLHSALPRLYCWRDAHVNAHVLMRVWVSGRRHWVPSLVPSLAHAAVALCHSRPAWPARCKSTLCGAQLLWGERGSAHPHHETGVQNRSPAWGSPGKPCFAPSVKKGWQVQLCPELYLCYQLEYAGVYLAK